MYQLHEYPINAYQEILRADYKRQGVNVEFWPFFYNAEFLALAPSSSANVVNTSDEDADFAVFNTMQVAFTTGGTFTPSPNCTVRIVYDVSGRRLDDRDTHIINICGRGARPFWWPRPWLIAAKASWSTTLNNLDTANTFNVRICFGGVKVFRLPLRG